MKKGNFFGFNLLLFSVLFVSSTLAQDSPQWHLPKGVKVRLGKGRISPIAYSPDGNLLAVGTAIGIWIYDVHTGAELELLTGRTSEVDSLAFSPDGTTLASGDASEVQLWDTETWQFKTTFANHTDGGLSIAFSPDGNTLASGSEGGTVLLWDLTPPTNTPFQLSIYDVNQDGIVNLADLAKVGTLLG